jgi:hypothetical protein
MKTINSLIAVVLLASPWIAQAEELIGFEIMDQNVRVAEARCVDSASQSVSAYGKQMQIFQAELDSDQVMSILDGRQSVLLQGMSTRASVHTKGLATLSEVQRVDVTLRLKSSEGEVINTTVVRWSDRPSRPRAFNLYRRSRVEVINQGEPQCSISGEGIGSKSCKFDASKSLSRVLMKNMESLKKFFQHRGSQGLIIEVEFKTFMFADCSEMESQAFAFGSSEAPSVILSRH